MGMVCCQVCAKVCIVCLKNLLGNDPITTVSLVAEGIDKLASAVHGSSNYRPQALDLSHIMYTQYICGQ
jgi:hypothetical protein